MNKEETMKMVNEKMGFIPNLLDTMSSSPASVRVYVEGALTMAEGVLSAAEQQVVYLTTSVFHECPYCTSAHSVMGKDAGVSKEDVKALRSSEWPKDQRLANIAKATRLVLEKRGHLDAEDLAQLEGKGIDKAQLYDIVCLSSIKTITNWISHFEKPEIDEEFTYRG